MFQKDGITKKIYDSKLFKQNTDNPSFNIDLGDSPPISGDIKILFLNKTKVNKNNNNALTNLTTSIITIDNFLYFFQKGHCFFDYI